MQCLLITFWRPIHPSRQADGNACWGQHELLSVMRFSPYYTAVTAAVLDQIKCFVGESQQKSRTRGARLKVIPAVS